MKLFRNKSILAAGILATILAISISACAPEAVNTPPSITISPAATPAPANTIPAAPVVTVTPANTPAPQPTVGPATPPVITPVTIPPIQNTPGSYPNSALLVDTGWLAAHLSDQNFIIIDARPAANYAAGHITGAVNLPNTLLDTTNAAGDTTVLRSTAELADIFGKAGISHTARIIVYSASMDYPATRVFWALENLGHKDVHVLDGGYAKWTADGNSVVTWNTVRTATTFTASPNASVIATKTDVLNSLNNTNVMRIDSRNAADFIVKRIPNSINILMADYLNSDGTVKSVANMTTFLTSKGITPGKIIIGTCYVGFRSTQAYFIFRLMGYTVSNYDGSSTEWFADPALPTQP